MELVRALGPTRRVLALDDGVVTGGGSLPFQSIEEVARECLQALVACTSSSSSSSSCTAIHLGGWSYGGVVAVEIAQQVEELCDPPLAIQLLALFDAPLRAPPRGSDEEHSEVDHARPDRLQDGELQRRVQAHFASCTRLLSAYQQRPYPYPNPLPLPTPDKGKDKDKGKGLVRCALLDLRPSASAHYDCGFAAVQEVVAVPSLARRLSVPGTHWTMLFGENANAVADAMKKAADAL
jgi:thioesterase domain-containing protein